MDCRAFFSIKWSYWKVQWTLMTVTAWTYKPLCNEKLHLLSFQLCYPDLLEGFCIFRFVSLCYEVSKHLNSCLFKNTVCFVHWMRPLNVFQNCNLILVLQLICIRKQKWGCRQNFFFIIWFPSSDFIAWLFFLVFLLFRLNNSVVIYLALGFICSVWLDLFLLRQIRLLPGNFFW